jgi:cobalt-zinc-cadmium efflux system membrane fusion protein
MSRTVVPARAYLRIAAVLALLFATSRCSCGTEHEGAADASTGNAPAGSEAAIRIGTVGEHEVGRSIETTARITFDDMKVAHVFPPVTGRVISIDVPLGAVVRKDQPLGTISSPDLATALSDVNKAEADLAAANHELKRQRELARAGAGVRRDLDLARDNQQRAAAEANRAKEKARLLTGHATEAGNQSYRLRSPIAGQVISRNVNPGMEVQGQYSGGATAELFTIGRLDSVWVIGDIYEQDLKRIRAGAAARVRPIAFPNTNFDCTIDWISGAVDPATRTVKVRCTLPNPNEQLKPGMFASMSIKAPGRLSLAIPRSAILHLGDKTVVIVAGGADGGEYERRPVIVDENEPGDWVPVQHGLTRGEQIVTSGALLLAQHVQ